MAYHQWWQHNLFIQSFANSTVVKPTSEPSLPLPTLLDSDILVHD